MQLNIYSYQLPDAVATKYPALADVSDQIQRLCTVKQCRLSPENISHAATVNHTLA